MVREASPNKLQREGKLKEALEEFIAGYIHSLEEGDRFISAIYLDEVLQTLLLDTGSLASRLSDSDLRKRLSDMIGNRIPPNRLSDYQDDVEIAIRKRFPEKYKTYFGESAKERDEN